MTDNQNRQVRIGQVLVLALTATLMAELFTGSTPVSRAYMLLTEFLMYGSGVVLIRELVRRLGLGWINVLLLGAAYGLVEEGLVLQSIFNPHFIGIDNSFGRMAGVNWIWAEFITGLHCFWSITGAIIVSEIIYFRRKDEPWLNRTGLWITGAIFLLTCVAMHALFVKLFHFKASAASLLLLLVIVIAVVILALRIRVAGRDVAVSTRSRSHPAFWAIALITFLACACWFLGLGAVFSGKKLPPLLVFIWGVFILCVYFWAVTKWFYLDLNSYLQRLALATGLLASELVWGCLLTMHNPVDRYGQILCIVIVGIMIYRLSKRETKLVT